MNMTTSVIHTTSKPRRGFSLVELLIVILIIALIIAIVLPALSHTRTLARRAATTNLMNGVSQACSQFQLSERRLPGYFSAKDMGSKENLRRGFTAMENVMFDLAGGVLPPSAGVQPYYGPTTANMVSYDPDMVGVAQAGSKAYFTPPAKYFRFQDGLDGGLKASSVPEHIARVRDLVDAEGTPLLFWGKDDMAVKPVATLDDFAQAHSGSPTAGPAWFYWSCNGAFLNGTAVGTKGKDETTLSLLGTANIANVLVCMGAMLGNPSAPNNIANTGAALLPTSARGQFIIQSAGADAVYLGRDDKGGKMLTTPGVLSYDLNFRSQPSSDVMKDFDDILVPGGG
jgi:prepilin-type N-terminal cleavage/methylation domain-containing protein